MDSDVSPGGRNDAPVGWVDAEAIIHVADFEPLRKPVRLTLRQDGSVTWFPLADSLPRDWGPPPASYGDYECCASGSCEVCRR